MEGNRKKARRYTAHVEVEGVQDISQRRDRKKGKASVKEDGGRGITFRYIREVKRRDRYENVFVRPMNYVKTLKLQSRVGDLDLPERRKTYTSCRQEEGEDAQMCLLRQILAFERLPQARTFVRPPPAVRLSVLRRVRCASTSRFPTIRTCRRITLSRGPESCGMRSTTLPTIVLPPTPLLTPAV